MVQSNSGGLLDIKEEPWQLDVNKDSRPFMGLCCNQCTTSSRSQCSEDMMWRGFIEQPRPNSAVAKAQQEQWLHNVLAVDTVPRSSFWARRFCHISSVWQYKKYDYPQLAPTVLRDERLHQAVQMAAKQDCGQLGEESEEYMGLVQRHEDRATKILYDMRSTLSDFLLRWLLRRLGAFFIKRRMDPVQGRRDIVYRAVLQTYMLQCLRAGHNVEFFIEGGRTRTGKTCLPKAGLLSVIVDAYTDGTIEDALLVPVSVNYEKLVDGNFVREQLGQPKQMETFGTAIKSIWSVLNSNYGIGLFIPCVKQGQDSQVSRQENTTHCTLKCITLWDRHRGRRAKTANCAQATAVMSTNAVAFLLLNKFRNGCELLGPGLVRRERVTKPGEEPTIMIRPFVMVPNVIELSYYSNMLLSHYVLDSVVATALCSLLDTEPENKQMAGDYQLLTFSMEAVQQRAMELCEVLQFEFPTYTEDQLWSRRYSTQFDEDSESGEDVGPTETQTLMLDTRPEAQETLEFYHGMLRPLVDTYTASALGLQHLVDRQLTERDLVQELLCEMRTQLKRGFAQFEESLSVDAFRNSLKLFERWDVLECITHDRIKLYYLSEDFDNDKSVQTVFEKVKRFSASH
ncbi:hypothetical protein C0J52_11784 [Blattella germanica]|nr:hypothetical protein C0J52_11784 [Blattella germanica]